MSWPHSAWIYVWDNVLPPSLWSLAGFAAGYWRLRLHVTRGHRIAADLYEHHTGRVHPDAPRKRAR